eukprot:CAMPEP_0204378932 /NCGR_PEP_ID=MMETSP0469-20131031/52210_1 /ASSEMBLY_ACC=CAM_ASM_000384 /TAXON_ID=2969 /ORGANISM="Oxyrrhis marina" /LENGTH=91 /DNA_ID=CAMNT_0051370319 /DNA_START=15 /DNA_END=287 /DNA_ORIENTATION=+
MTGAPPTAPTACGTGSGPRRQHSRQARGSRPAPAPNLRQRGEARCSTVQHGAARCSTVQHSTAQHSTAQHSTAQHRTTQYRTAPHNTVPHR